MKTFFLISLLSAGIAVSAIGAGEDFITGTVAVSDSSEAVNDYERLAANDDITTEQRFQAGMSAAALLLQRGDTAAAEKIEKDLCRIGDTGQLRAEILLNRGNFQEAELEFNTYAARTEGRKSLRARLNAAVAGIAGGGGPNANDILDLRDTAAHAGNGDIAAEAEAAAVFRLIRNGDFSTASSILKNSAYRYPDSGFCPSLDMLSAAARGDEAAVLALHPPARAAMRTGEYFHFLITMETADFCQRFGASRTALLLLNDALLLSRTENDRKNIMRLSADANADNSPGKAAETLKKYLEFYPDDPDELKIKFQLAALLCRNGGNSEGCGLYESICAGTYDAASKRKAAHFGALAAENGDNSELAEKMYDFMAENSVTQDEKLEVCLLRGKFFCRQKKYDTAEKYLSAVDTGEFADEARARLLDLLMAAERYEESAVLCSRLQQSDRRNWHEYGDYYSAVLCEKQGAVAEARRRYTAFASENPDSVFSAAAAFAAARLAMEAWEMSDAVRDFTAYADKYPDAPSAKKALFLAVQCAFFMNDMTTAEQLISKMPPETAVLARLQLADFLIAEGNSEKAQMQTDNIPDAAAAVAGYLPDKLYRQAQIHIQRKNISAALELLVRIISENPETGCAADSALLVGDIKYNSGKYTDALDYYTLAEQYGREDGFVRRCRGKCADCAMRLYETGHKEQMLTEAMEKYQELTECGIPDISLQSRYKLGKCLEYSGKPETAVKCYLEILLQTERVYSGEVPAGMKIWCSRAGMNAAALILRQCGSRGSGQALAVLRLMSRMGLTSTEEFEIIRKEIQTTYNLEK